MRLATDTIPQRDRVERVREVFGRQILRFDIEVERNTPFRCDFTLRDLPGLRLVSGYADGVTSSRTKNLLIDGSDDVFVSCNFRGCLVAEQRGSRFTMGPGDFHIGSCAEPISYIHVDREATALLVPRRVLVPFVPDLDDGFARLLDKNSPPVRLLHAYVRALDNEFSHGNSNLMQLAVTHIHDLLALALGATGDAEEVAKNRGVRASRLHMIKSDIARNLVRLDLSVGAIAMRHNLTPRTVQRLFETEGTTFTEFLLDRRLAHAHRMLRGTRNSDMAVSSVAYSSGFSDISNFNRSFRRRYGASPTEIRRQASDDGRGFDS